MNNTLLRSYCRYCKILFCKHVFKNNIFLKKIRDFEKSRDFLNRVILKLRDSENNVILKIPRVTGSDRVNNT